MAPADEIVTLFSTFALRFRIACAAFSCTKADGDARSAMRGRMPPANAIDNVLVILAQVGQCDRSILLHADRYTNAKYTFDTGQTRNKLLAQWVHLTNHAAPTEMQEAQCEAECHRPTRS